MRTSHLFFFNDTATTEIYTLSLHDALPILQRIFHAGFLFLHLGLGRGTDVDDGHAAGELRDRKSTRLNSSHSQISYAVFCLKKKQLSPLGRRTDQPPQSPFRLSLQACSTHP